MQTLSTKELQQEIDRLSRNSGNLFEILPEMVFIISDQRIIQYMNALAIKRFGDLTGKLCSEYLCNANQNCAKRCPLLISMKGKSSDIPLDARIGEIYTEFTHMPFAGYKGHSLVMLLMRDITKRKDQQRALEQVNEKIEEVLKHKIQELNENESVRSQLLKQVNTLKEKLVHSQSDGKIIGKSKKMQLIRQLVHQVAPTDSIILVTGESGTGKELIANLIHQKSLRAKKPYLSINCSSLNDNLLESELFGHEKGAFTGASSTKKGKFETVDGGTIFLDEIGDISPRMQSSLLRVLQNGEIIRVGGSQPIKVDVRVIAATNKDLGKAIEENEFRLDLFYRLSVINIRLPPLRERQDDIIDLAVHFISQFRETFKKAITFLPNNVIDLLLRHDWPGNIRELQNVLHRAVLICPNTVLSKEDIVFDDPVGQNNVSEYFNNLVKILATNSLKETLAQAEKDLIKHTLKELGGNTTEAIQYLQIGKTALYEKIKRYNIHLN